ncbi:MAG TPA: RNA polymerase-binding protein DksA, partial [Gammaproteobacteria bacterium]|nr:RNA polymerase-binding protein DksA [Gammaproteobacteria bacterium]
MSEPDFQDIPAYKPAKNEEFMSTGQIEHFQIKLNTWRKQLISDAESTITHIKEDSTQVADINDR